MALDTYANLKTAVQDWLARTDLSAKASDWVTLGEARLNRHLDPAEVDQTLTGTLNSRRIDVSAYSIVAPIALFLVDPDTSDERKVTQRAEGQFVYLSTSGAPTMWGMDSSQDYIDMDRPCDQAYSFRFRYSQRFALSDSVTTNWLLANHPDVYLAACIVWGCAFTGRGDAGAFKAVWDEGIAEVRHIIARNNRGELRVDPALASMNWKSRGTYQGVG